MPQTTKDQVTQTQGATEEQGPKLSDAPIAMPDDVTDRISELNQVRAAIHEIRHQTYDEAHEDNRKLDFMKAIVEARTNTQAAKEYTPPPLPEAIKKQTELEMEAGRKAVAAHEARRLAQLPRPPQENTTMTPVFRPADFVPDQKKGQGAKNLISSGNL